MRLWYIGCMTTIELKRAERIASENESLARRALTKSDQVQAYLSLLEYRSGRTRAYSSARALLKKVKSA